MKWFRLTYPSKVKNIEKLAKKKAKVEQNKNQRWQNIKTKNQTSKWNNIITKKVLFHNLELKHQKWKNESPSVYTQTQYYQNNASTSSCGLRRGIRSQFCYDFGFWAFIIFVCFKLKLLKHEAEIVKNEKFRVPVSRSHHLSPHEFMNLEKWNFFWGVWWVGTWYLLLISITLGGWILRNIWDLNFEFDALIEFLDNWKKTVTRSETQKLQLKLF